MNETNNIQWVLVQKVSEAPETGAGSEVSKVTVLIYVNQSFRNQYWHQVEWRQELQWWQMKWLVTDHNQVNTHPNIWVWFSKFNLLWINHKNLDISVAFWKVFPDSLFDSCPHRQKVISLAGFHVWVKKAEFNYKLIYSFRSKGSHQGCSDLGCSVPYCCGCFSSGISIYRGARKKRQ